MKRLIALLLSVSILMSNVAPVAMALDEDLSENGQPTVETVLEVDDETPETIPNEETAEQVETTEQPAVETEDSAQEPEAELETLVEEPVVEPEEPVQETEDGLMQTMEVVASGTCGVNTSWSLDGNGVLTISYTPADGQSEKGRMTDFTYSGNGVAPWKAYNASIKEIIVEEGIIHIGAYAFHSCYNAEKITLPSFAESIGKNAFYGCKAAKSIILPGGISELSYGLFYDCWALEEINVPGSVQTINSYAFYECQKLNTVSLPKSLKKIDSYAFMSCYSLEKVYYGGVKEDWEAIDIASGNNKLTEAKIKLADGTTLGDTAGISGQCGENATWRIEGDTIIISGTGGMYDWDYDTPWKDYLDIIKHVIIEEGITDTGDFCYFAAETAQLPESLKRIGADSFCGYQGSTITIPSNVEYIAESAFTDSLLETIYIPRSVQWIEANSFARCNLLTEINVDPYNERYKSIDGVVYSEDGKTLVVVPAGKQGNTYSVKVGTEVIDWAAFRSSDFVNIELPEGITSIKGLAFLDSVDLETITIPHTVTEIGFSAFDDCKKLKTVYYTGTQQQWNALLAAADTSYNEALFNAEVKFVSQSGDSTPIGEKCGDNAAWRIENGTLIISGTGATYDYDYEPGKWAPWEGEDYDKVVVEKGITHIGMFSLLGWSSSVSLPEGLKSLGYGAIEYFRGEEIVLPSTLEEIGPYALGMSQKLTSISIPANVHTIHGSSFGKGEKLESIIVDENNRYFESVDGMVYRKADNALVAVPAAVPFETVTVREGTKVIEAEAFSGAYINKVVLPNTVETLQIFAFEDCKYLAEITIPASVKVIERYAFTGCTDLEKVNYGGTQEQWDALMSNLANGNDPLLNAQVTVSEKAEGTVAGLTWKLEGGTLTISGNGAMPDFEDRAEAPWYGYKNSIKDVVISEGVTRVGSKAFASYKLDSVSLPDGLLSVGVEAFVDYKGTKINLPDTIQSLERLAFGFAHKVKQVFIPRSLHNISETAFSSGGIEQFYVDPENPVYSSDNGVIYTENGKILFAFPTGRHEPFTIPDYVETIGEYAFWGANIVAVTGMENVRTIEERAFYVAEQLKTISISKNIDTIAEDAFANCDFLNTVIFNGDEEQWDRVCSRLASGNDYIADANVYFETDLHSELVMVYFYFVEDPVYYIPAGEKMLVMPVYEEEGYEFMGWWPNRNFIGEPLTADTRITEDTEFYPLMEKTVEPKVTGLTLGDADGNSLNGTIKLDYFREEPVFNIYPIITGEGRYSEEVIAVSSNEEILSVHVDEFGYVAVTAHKAGKATVTVTSRVNAKAKATLTFNVIKYADDAELAIKGLVKAEDGSYRTTVGTKLTPAITWIGGQAWSEYELVIPEEYSEILGYDAKGNIVAIGTGYGVIYIPDTNAWVGVHVYADKVKAVETSISKLVLDASLDLTGKEIVFWPSNEGACNEFEFTWTENPVIKVYKTGSNSVYAQALSNEKASITITAKALDGSGKTAKVTVQTGVIARSLQPTSVIPTKLAVGKSAKVTLSVLPADATLKTINWYAVDPDTYEDSDVVSVNGGTIKALKPGVAIVRAEPADGWGAVYTFRVEVTNPAQKVVIGDGAKAITIPLHESRRPIRLPVTVFGTATDENGKKVDTTEGIEQNVSVSVKGDMAKYINCWYDEETNELVLGTGPATKGTVTVTTTDGTNKSASINVVYEEHMTAYGFGVSAPKGVVTTWDRETFSDVWTVKEGTTVKPTVMYNWNGKQSTLPKALQKFEMEVVGEEGGVVVDNAKGTFKAVKPGKYEVTFRYTGGCEDCVTPEDVVIILEVAPKSATVLKSMSITVPDTVKGMGMIGDGDMVANIAQGSQIQLSALLNGRKPSGVNVVWKAYSVNNETGYNTEVTGLISNTGKLNLKDAAEGELYRVEVTATDKKDAENSITANLFVNVYKKPVAAEITLVNAEDGSDIRESVHRPSTEKEWFVLDGIDGTAGFYEVTSASPKVATVESVFNDAVGEVQYLVTYVGAGSATFNVMAKDGSNVKQAVKFKVDKHDVPVSAITMPVKAVTVNGGQQIAINYAVKGNAKTGAEASNPTILWTLDKNASFDNETAECITQDAEGTIYILTSRSNTGKVTLTGKAMDGSGKTVKITINVVKQAEGKAPERMYISFPANTANDGMPGAAVLTWGKSLGLKLNMVPTKADAKSVVWEVYCWNEEIGDWDADMAKTSGITIKAGKVTVAKASAKLTPYIGEIKVVAKMPYMVTTYQDGVGEVPTEISDEAFIIVKPAAEKIGIKQFISPTETSNTVQKTAKPGETVYLLTDITKNKFANFYHPMMNYPMLWSVNDSKLATIDEYGILTINPDAPKGKTVKVTLQTMDGTGKKATVSIKIG